MRQISRKPAALLLLLAVVACQGSVGSGPQLPVPPQNQVTPGQAGYAQQSRQQVVEGAVYLTSSLASIPLPPVNGFSVELVLHPGTPAPSPSASASPPPAGRGARTRAVATPSPSPSPSPTPTPSPTPSATGSPSAKAAPKSGGTPAPIKIDTKTTIYPDDPMSGPTPLPTGAVQTFKQRHALVRGYVMPHGDIALHSLGSIKFTLPESEQTSGRGWTVALYLAEKHNKTKLITDDTEASLEDNVVSAHDTSDGVTLKKDTGYVAVLYADDNGAPPPPPQNYPAPGQIPGQTPYPQGPGYPGQPTNPWATPVPYPTPPGQTPYPGQTPFGQPTPFPTATPFHY